jgi:hypothetical protein
MAAADIRDFFEFDGIAEHKAVAHWAALLRAIAHSWKQVDRSVKRSFHGSVHFVQSQLKKVPPAKPRFPLGWIHDPVSFGCVLVKIGKQVQTNCFMLKDQMVFDGYGSFHMEDVEYIFRRNRLHRDTALEFVLRTGNSYLADFAPRSAREVLARIEPERFEIDMVQLPGFKSFFKRHGDAQAWQEGKLSNFEYLLQTNMFAGRSFREETLDPFMPWRLLNFETFDLRDVRNFRDLHYPVQAQTSEQREDLQAPIDHSRPAGPDNAMFIVGPSNPTFVWLWLGRLPPFNGISPEKDPFPSLQAAFFDPVLARRNRELLPEFFCQPEIFENLVGLDVAEIELPK